MVKVVLLLMFDGARRRRLAAECLAVSPDVQCIECADADGAVFADAPERIDLVVLDHALLRRPGAAQLVHWWQSVPCGDLIVLEPDAQNDFEAFRPALMRALS